METQTNGHSNGVSANGNGHAPSPEALPMVHDGGLAADVIAKLKEPLDRTLVSRRQGRGGRSMTYMEGHTVIDQANRIFGSGGWGYSVIGEVVYREISSVDAKSGEIRRSGMYAATVRVEVPDVPSRTDVGCQPVTDDTVDGHDTAYKGAVTDALKRALRSFGAQFGNGLYGDGDRTAPGENSQGFKPPRTMPRVVHRSAERSASGSPRRPAGYPSASSREIRPERSRSPRDPSSREVKP